MQKPRTSVRVFSFLNKLQSIERQIDDTEVAKIYPVMYHKHCYGDGFSRIVCLITWSGPEGSSQIGLSEYRDAARSHSIVFR